MIGDVGGEIGPRPVRLLERPVDIVAELGRAEERLRPRLPIVRQLALGRLERADIDEAALLPAREALVDRPGVDQRALGGEHVVAHAERGEIGADQRHHLRRRRSRAPAPAILPRSRRARRAVARGERRAGLLEIVAGIEPSGIAPIGLAQRLAIAQMERARERIDLGAGVVDVVFAVDGEPGLGQQRRQRVADHGAAAVADMQRPGRIGRDIFDIDPRAAAHRRIAVSRRRRAGSRAAARARPRAAAGG